MPILGILASSKSGNLKPTVTGGTLTYDATYYYRAFTASGTLGVSGAALSCDVLTVAGGGGGAWDDVQFWSAGGGGAGGVLAFASQTLSANQTVTIGAGGAYNAPGTNSQFGSLTAAVGGGTGTNDAKNGGSGGGMTPRNMTVVGAGTPGQGYDGGNSSSLNSGGGGGGAGAVGSNVPSQGLGGAGGIGTNSVTNWGALSDVLTTASLGVSGYLAGGGGGGRIPYYAGVGAGAAGGTGGGGTGSPGGIGGAGTAGTVNTGSGGGASGGASTAGSGSGTPGAGGSGLIVVRYLKTAV